MNAVQKDSTPIISIDENTDAIPSQLLYTANDGYILLMNKEEVKSLFLPQSTLPNTGYFNGVLCVYSEQFCFYYFDDVTNEYQFIVWMWWNVLFVEKHNSFILCEYSVRSYPNWVKYNVLWNTDYGQDTGVIVE